MLRGRALAGIPATSVRPFSFCAYVMGLKKLGQCFLSVLIMK
jgi:hypothetical protein